MIDFCFSLDQKEIRFCHKSIAVLAPSKIGRLLWLPENNFWTSLNKFRQVLTNLNKFIQVCTTSDKFKKYHTSLKKVQISLKSSYKFEKVHISLKSSYKFEQGQIRQTWTSLEKFKPIWTCLDQFVHKETENNDFNSIYINMKKGDRIGLYLIYELESYQN